MRRNLKFREGLANVFGGTGGMELPFNGCAGGQSLGLKEFYGKPRKLRDYTQTLYTEFDGLNALSWGT
ncbi:hypothetical protein CC2G_000255 [Coprinopsis cinerea AmutBmut pab1-1]|nr:hypothetical protein CC2G_013739 [Coprinopsis cinerea AmutBmut pab1-1]KAG2022513.1 hypothetical protein CC2G_000255 [Coprinopsis cinerea AmutBmut pab1-1]